MQSVLWESVFAFAVSYGYPFVFVAALLETTFVLGLLVPGDVVVVVGGALSARGVLDFIWVNAVVLAGAIVGASFSFWIGRRGGKALVERWGARFADTTRVQAAEDYFRRHGAKTVLLAAFVAGLKNLVPAVAGASAMAFPRFIAYCAVGSAIRSAGLVAIGYVFGANLSRAVELSKRADGWLITGVVVAILAVVWAWRRRAIRQ